jgi:hypothetical protein
MISVLSSTTKAYPARLAARNAWSRLGRTADEQHDRLTDVAPGGGSAHTKSGRRLDEGSAFAQMGQHEQRLPAGVEAAPGRADRLTVAADETGQEGQS